MIPASVLCIQGTGTRLGKQRGEVFGVRRVAAAPLVEEPVVEDVEEAGNIFM